MAAAMHASFLKFSHSYSRRHQGHDDHWVNPVTEESNQIPFLNEKDRQVSSRYQIYSKHYSLTAKYKLSDQRSILNHPNLSVYRSR